MPLPRANWQSLILMTNGPENEPFTTVILSPGINPSASSLDFAPGQPVIVLTTTSLPDLQKDRG